MLFAQIIAFILVMVVFQAYQPGEPLLGPWQSLIACLTLWVWLWAGCKVAVARFLNKASLAGSSGDQAQAARRLMAKLQAAAVLCAVLMFTALDLKAHIMEWPAAAHWNTVSGLLAVAVFFLLLGASWSAAHPLERRILGQDIGRRAYVWGQARFVAPVVFPWLAVSLMQDLMYAIWPEGSGWMSTELGDLAFLAVFVVLMGVFLPPLVRAWWGCRRWPGDQARSIAEEVLRLTRVKVSGILSWPIMDGKLLTAGILGIAPRFRYLLLTPALAGALGPTELAAVVAHEAGHVRHRHLPMYLVFFMCFFLAAYALTGPMIMGLNLGLYWLGSTQWGGELLSGGSGAMLGLVLALPLVILLAVYLRFVMGFFMRHFERQADFFSLGFMGEAAPLAGALEKLALLSGDTRDAPSWHHFSVSQRVRALQQAQENPALIGAHEALLRRSLAVFFCCLALVLAVGFGSRGLGLEEGLNRSLVIQALETKLMQQPRNPVLHLNLGALKFESGKEAEGVAHLNTAVALAPNNPEAINALAWFLATAKDESLRRPQKALALAQRAVTLAPLPHIWDTLAEAYFINNRPKAALAAEKAAIKAGPKENQEHYQKQLERFKQAVEEAGG